LKISPFSIAVPAREPDNILWPVEAHLLRHNQLAQHSRISWCPTLGGVLEIWRLRSQLWNQMTKSGETIRKSLGTIHLWRPQGEGKCQVYFMSMACGRSQGGVILM